jgi:hypothetical protein
LDATGRPGRAKFHHRENFANLNLLISLTLMLPGFSSPICRALLEAAVDGCRLALAGFAGSS